MNYYKENKEVIKMSEQLDKFYKEKTEQVKKANTERERLDQRWLELRESYENHSKKFAPIKKGWIFTKTICPVCGNELNRVVIVESYNTYISHSGLFQGTTIHIDQRDLYTCGKCGYEYAYKEGDDFN